MQYEALSIAEANCIVFAITERLFWYLEKMPVSALVNGLPAMACLNKVSWISLLRKESESGRKAIKQQVHLSDDGASATLHLLGFAGFMCHPG